MTPEQDQALLEAIYAGEKIRAIKLRRETSGGGLAEAKEFVEKLEAELRVRHPERFAIQLKSKGCLGVFAAVWLVLAGLICLASKLLAASGAGD